MQNPATDIVPIIHNLTTTDSRVVQQATVQKYFLSNASFNHPLCKVEKFEGSREWVEGIFDWYKWMSPKIELTVHGAAFDEANGKLYVDITQVFGIWFVPIKQTTARLTTVLTLERRSASPKKLLTNGSDSALHSNDHIPPTQDSDPSITHTLTPSPDSSSKVTESTGKGGKMLWYIAHQEDLYQTEQWVDFIPFLPGMRFVVGTLKLGTGIGCSVFAWIGATVWPWGQRQ